MHSEYCAMSILTPVIGRLLIGSWAKLVWYKGKVGLNFYDCSKWTTLI